MSGFFDDASWVLIPEGIKEDVVYAQKPTSGLGDLQFTRASDATRTNSAGVIERTPWNLLQQSEMFSNAVWTKVNSTISIDATLAPNGTMTADKLVEDTSTSEHNVRQDYSTTVTGSFFVSIYAKAAERSFLQFVSSAAFVSSRVNFDLTNGTVTAQGVGVTGTIESAGNGWWRCIVSATSSGSGTIRTQWNLITSGTAARVESYTGNGTSGIFIWGAQLVEGTDAKPYFATTNRQDVPRLDYRNADGSVSTCPRLLLEPQRTNSIRNSTMVGAVAGSPGTLPTNWNSSPAGLTQTVVGIGTENGLPYIDLRFNGMATGTELLVSTETINQIVAANAQAWTNSFYLRLIAQPNPPVSIYLNITERTSAGSFVTSGNSAGISVTSSLNRFSFVRTLSGGATVGAVQPRLGVTLTLAATYDFTIRIAAPQMELGAYATTFIPTTTAAVTRLADVASKTGVSDLIGQTEGTLFIDCNLSAVAAERRLLTISNGTETQRIIVWTNGTLLYVTLNNVISINLGNFPLGTTRVAFGYTISGGSTTYSVKVNNNALVTGTSVVAPSPLNTINLGCSTTGALTLSDGVNQAALFTTRLTNAQLAAITTL
jgi:hypothetical protein